MTDENDEHKEFKESLEKLTDEMIVRFHEVGLEQSAAEYWEQAKQGMQEACDRLAEYRRVNNIPESEI